MSDPYIAIEEMLAELLKKINNLQELFISLQTLFEQMAEEITPEISQEE